MKKIVYISLLLIVSLAAAAQEYDTTLYKLHRVKILPDEPDTLTKLTINGQVVSAKIIDGDTLIIATIDDVSISSPRTFASKEDYLKYRKYKRYAAKVYPYAKEAIRIFSEAEEATKTMKRRKRKRYLKKLSKELKKEFEQPLRKLSKTQGKILVKMIEKELEAPMYDLIKMTRGRFNAFYWNQSSKLYGYRLKEGYVKGKNPILDVVLQDLDISYKEE